MPDKSLTDQLGYRYMRDFFSTAWFVKDDKLYYLISANSSGLICTEFDPTTDMEKGKDVTVPHEKITSFSDFSYPKLGYRNVPAIGEGSRPSIAALSLNRSVHRGFRVDLINNQFVNYSTALSRSGISGWDYLPSQHKAKIVFFPEWKSWTAGLSDLKDNKYYGFAVNEDVAVTISCSHTPEHDYDVLFRGAVIGGVTRDGTITFNKERKVNVAISKLFEEDVSSGTLRRM